MKSQYSGRYLLFSYMSEDDLFSVCRMLEKDSVCRWLFFGPNSHEATKKYFEPLILSMNEEISGNILSKTLVFTIKEKKSGLFAGQCALLPVDFSEGAYTIAYQLDDIFWRRGFGTEACRFLIYYAFFIAGGYRLNGDCVRENTGSCRIMEKCGFKPEGVMKDYWNHEGKYYDRLLYGLLKNNISMDEKNVLENDFLRSEL